MIALSIAFIALPYQYLLILLLLLLKTWSYDCLPAVWCTEYTNRIAIINNTSINSDVLETGAFPKDKWFLTFVQYSTELHVARSSLSENAGGSTVRTGRVRNQTEGPGILHVEL